MGPPGKHFGTAPSAPGGAGQDTAQTVLTDASGLLANLEAWDSLASDAIEPNPFYESWMLQPALKLYGHAGLRFLMVFVRDPGKGSGSQVLSGIFPLEFGHHYHGVPARVTRLWQYLHCYLCAPLLRACHARQCVSAFIQWMVSSGQHIVELGEIPADGPFHQLLIDQLNERQMLSHAADLHTRPVLRLRTDGETYLQLALSSHRRRNTKRRERHLAESKGQLEYHVLDSSQDVSEWIEAFLRLEASGWKGREGSALACTEAAQSFFAPVIHEAHARGRLYMTALRLDGKPIAMKTMFCAGGGGFLFKPAYDEAYARFSPGILLDIHVIRQLHEMRNLAWVDTCTNLNNSLLHELYIDRRTIQTLILSTGRGPGNLIVASLPLLRWFRRTLRRAKAPSRATGRPVFREDDGVEQGAAADTKVG